MAEIKAHEFDGAAKRLVGQHRFFLIFGPDRGLVSERASELARLTKVPLDDPFSLVKLDAGDLGEAGRLAEEAGSIGLFGGEKLVWIRGSGGEKALVDGSAMVLSQPIEGAFVIVEAGDLKKGTGLRKLVETTPQAAGIPCYADDDRAVSQLIDRELGAEGLMISPEARALLIDILGGDRMASRNEIRKLALYARGEKRIEEHHVIEIVGDASAVSADDAIDAILRGNPDDFVHAIQKVSASKTGVFVVLQACLRQLQQLDLMRADMAARGINAQQAIATHARNLHFRRKPAVEAALQSWSGEALAAEMNRIQAAILMSRQISALDDPIAAHTLLATTLLSRRNRR